MTSKQKIQLLTTLKAAGITSAKQFVALEGKKLTRMCKTLAQAEQFFDFQDAVKASDGKNSFFDYLLSDDEENAENLG